MNLAALYDALSSLWSDCLWNGWKVNEEQDTDIVEPPQSSEYITEVVTERRQDGLLLEALLRITQIWKKLPKEARSVDTDMLRVVDIRRNKKRKELVLGTAPNSEIPSNVTVARLIAEEIYWNDILLEELPALGGFTIRDLLETWNVLHSLAEVAVTRLPSNTEVRTLKHMLEYAPAFQMDECCRAISVATSLKRTQVESILKVFTFGNNPRLDPWHQPLIEIDQNHFCPILPALTTPNLIRSIENWMKVGGIDMSERGVAFERYVRRMLKIYLLESHHLQNSYVSSSSVDLTSCGSTEQLDLVWIIANLVIIGEVKCCLYPVEPLEWHNYFEVLRNAASQAKRKAQFVQDNLSELNRELKDLPSMDLSGCTVTPIVVTNLALGSGMPFLDVPVVDMYILSTYIQGRQEFGITASTDGLSKPVDIVNYHNNEAEAAVNFVKTISFWPTCRIYADDIDSEVLPLTGASPLEKPAGHLHLFIRSGIPSPEDKQPKP